MTRQEASRSGRLSRCPVMDAGCALSASDRHGGLELSLLRSRRLRSLRLGERDAPNYRVPAFPDLSPSGSGIYWRFGVLTHRCSFAHFFGPPPCLPGPGLPGFFLTQPPTTFLKRFPDLLEGIPRRSVRPGPSSGCGWPFPLPSGTTSSSHPEIEEEQQDGDHQEQSCSLIGIHQRVDLCLILRRVLIPPPCQI